MIPVINYTRPHLFDYQKKILDSPARYTVTEAATKVGKTASHIIWLFEQALLCKANQSVWWVAPSIGQAKVAFDRMKVQISDKRIFKSNETNRVITLKTGVKIEFKTAENPDNLYGDDVYAAVFDEFTRAREAAWIALRTTLTSTGGKCKFIGNVKGKKNWGYKMGQRARAGAAGFEYFKITAYDAADAGMATKDGRPFIEEIEAAKSDLPESAFNELYLAEPQEDGTNPFGLDHIRRAVYPMSNLPAICYGIDLANSVDFAVIIGLDVAGAVCHFQRFNKVGWTNTTNIIKSLPNKPMQLDSTGVGDPIVETVQITHDAAVGKVFSSRSKQQLMEGLALAIQSRKLTIPPDPNPDGMIPDSDPGNIQRELEAFEYEYTRSGIKYSSIIHDDCVCALALAWDLHKSAVTSGTYSWA